MEKKRVTEKQLQAAIIKYKKQLFDDPKVSPTAFKHMEVALLGARYIINDAFGTPRKMEMSWDK